MTFRIMKRRTILAGLAAGAFPAAVCPSAAFAQADDQADLARVSSYLNGVHTLKARFDQLAPDGSTSQGLAWIQRPGRMRFQYDPPTPLLLVAGHGLFVYYDRELQQTTNIPVGDTPLGILLRDPLDLTGDVRVTGVARLPGQLQVTVLRTKTPSDGTLTLIFSEGPLTLRQWVVVDARRQQTRVTLSNIQYGGTFDQDMFVFINPKFIPGSDKLYR